MMFGPFSEALQMPVDSTHFTWVALRASADGAFKTFVCLFCFLHLIFMLTDIVRLW